MNMFKPFLNTFHMYIIWTWKYVSRVQYLIHVFLFFLLLSWFSPLLLSVFFKFKRFKLIHLRWPPAVRIKSCLLSSTFHTLYPPGSDFKEGIQNWSTGYKTRTKFVPKLPTKTLNFYYWILLLVKKYAALFINRFSKRKMVKK